MLATFHLFCYGWNVHSKDSLRSGVPTQRAIHFTFIQILAAMTAVLLPSATSLRADPDPSIKRLFEGSLIPALRLEISPSDIASLKNEPRKYVRATLWEDEKAYTNIAVHLKAGVGSFKPIDDKPAFTLKMDQFVDGQRFHGLAKWHLNNSTQDPSYMKEKISRELFEKAGVLVPRAGHAVVELNGRKLGLYVLLEGVDRQFLARQFRNTEGNVYDGYWYGDVNAALKVNSGKHREDRSGLTRLADAVQEPDSAMRAMKLRAALDVDRFISFMAMEVILGHHDGYSLDVNNYRIFHNLEDNKMVFIPHGMDLMFERAAAPIDARMKGLVAKRVVEDPEFHKRYLERVAQFSTNIIQVALITNRIYEIAGRIEPLLTSDAAAPDGHHHRDEVERIVKFFVDRSAFLERFRDTPKP